MCKWMETAEKQNIYIMCPKKKKKPIFRGFFFFFLSEGIWFSLLLFQNLFLGFDKHDGN